MKLNRTALVPLLVGVASTHGLATAFIARSNQTFYEKLETLNAAGYLIVPNAHVLPSLKTFASAFNSALFFSLTVGLALSVMATVAARLRGSLPHRGKAALTIILALMWVGSIGLANANGLDGFCTALLMVPAVVFAMTVRMISGTPAPVRYWAYHLLFFVGFAAIVAFQADTTVFLNIRDRLLLSTPVGKTLNAFYYHHSLYAAQIFKSQRQRLLKTCYLEPGIASPLQRRLAGQLARQDYLPVDRRDADLQVSLRDGILVLTDAGRARIEVPADDFFKDVPSVIQDFQRQNDRHAFFRSLTMASLLLSSALILYGLLFAPLYAICRPLASTPVSFFTAASLCILCGGMAIYALSRRPPVEINDLDTLLTSAESRDQVAALKFIGENRIDIGKHPAAFTAMKSPSAAVRYWFARALGHSRHPDTAEWLSSLLDDPDFNVACMALYAMGQRRDRRVVPTIKLKLQTSKNWYEQWYGYRALKMLGWTQRPSI